MAERRNEITPSSGTRERRQRRRRAEAIVHFLIVLAKLPVASITDLVSQRAIAIYIGLMDGSKLPAWMIQRSSFLRENVAKLYWLIFVCLTWIKPFQISISGPTEDLGYGILLDDLNGL